MTSEKLLRLVRNGVKIRHIKTNKILCNVDGTLCEECGTSATVEVMAQIVAEPDAFEIAATVRPVQPDLDFGGRWLVKAVEHEGERYCVVARLRNGRMDVRFRGPACATREEAILAWNGEWL